MKNIITFIVLLAVVQSGQSQCPQNTVPGSTINEFDWTAEKFDMYILDYPSPFLPPYKIYSPFADPNNTAQFNVNHFAQENPVDNVSANGWEILFYNFGTPEVLVDEPSFALYNRYNGLLRFFMFISDKAEAAYQQAFISTYISELGDVFTNSALLESQNAIHHSLEDFEKKLSINTVNSYNVSSGTWIVSEWLTHYDPCTCLSTMNLTFFPTLQSIQSVNLNIDGSTSTVPIYEADTENNGLIRSAIGVAGSQIEALSGAYKKGNEVYKNFAKFASVIEESLGEENLKKAPDILTAIAQIGNGASTGNYVAIAAGLISFVNTFVSTTESKTIISYSSKHKFEATGTIDTKTPYPAAQVYVPGSNHAGYPIAKKPIYDNILGIASIVERPTFDYLEHKVEYQQFCDINETNSAWYIERSEHYRLKTDIGYAINTSAGIKPLPKDIKVSLYFDLGSFYVDSEFVDDNLAEAGLIKVSKNLWRTPYMNPSCLKEYPITYITSVENDCPYEPSFGFSAKPYLSLAMILESEDGQEIGYLKSYEITKAKDPSYNWANVPSNQFLDVPEGLVIDYQDINSTTQSWGNTTVENPPSKETVINNNSGGSTIVFLDTDNDPTTPIKYTTDEFTVDCGEVLPMTEIELSGFCNNKDKYNPIVALRQSDPVEKVTVEIEPLKLMPNPVDDYVTIQVSYSSTTIYRIFNSMGQVVIEGEMTDSSIFLGNLSSGMYILQLFDNEKLIADEKLIKL